jgi:sec-independent protein translocase protein TatC
MSTSAVPMELDDGRMSLMEHLTELRDRIIKILIALAVGMALAFALYNQIYDFLLQPYEDLAESRDLVFGEGGRLLNTDPLEGFAIRMKLALYGGIAIAMPVILWQVWRFVTPGLYPHEKRYAIPFIVSALALFVLGAGLAYYTLPRALEFLIDIGGSDNFVTAYAPGKYFQLITYMMLAFGIGFEFPILLIFMQMAGVVGPQQLASVRRYAIVGICVLVAVITPSGDPISMLMLSVPMMIFYEAAILIGRLLERRRAARPA